MPKSPREKPNSLVPFEYVVGNPEAWQEVAHDLVGCANILLDAALERKQLQWLAGARGSVSFRVVMMLYGFAAENLIKAIIVAKNPICGPLFPVSKGTLVGRFANHNLPELVKEAGLGVSASQEHLLKRLKEFIECGKYPVGRREGEGRATQVSFGALDWSDVLQLLGYLEEELQRASGGLVAAHPDLRGIHRVCPRRGPAGYG